MSGRGLRRHVRITIGFGIECDPDWEPDVHQAFAKLGWTVTSMGPAGSSTHPEDDQIEIRSDGREADLATLCNVLAELGMTEGSFFTYDDPNDASHFGNYEYKALTHVNEAWWDACPDPRGLISVAQLLRAYGRLGDSTRKSYLCACAAGRFCTRSWGGKVGPVLDVLERYADRVASEGDLLVVRDAVLGRGANPLLSGSFQDVTCCHDRR